MRFLASITLIMLAAAAMAQSSPGANTAVDQLIPWLLDEDQQLRGVPFSEVIFDTTGKKVFSFDVNNPVDHGLLPPLRTEGILTEPDFKVCGDIR